MEENNLVLFTKVTCFLFSFLFCFLFCFLLLFLFVCFLFSFLRPVNQCGFIMANKQWKEHRTRLPLNFCSVTVCRLHQHCMKRQDNQDTIFIVKVGHVHEYCMEARQNRDTIYNVTVCHAHNNGNKTGKNKTNKQDRIGTPLTLLQSATYTNNANKTESGHR